MTALRRKFGRRDAIAAVGLGAAAALSVATFSNPRLAQALGESVNQGVESVKTVAAMLAERSPGQRPEGALASLKHKRQAALHQRALPKVRAPGPTAYEALVSPPPVPGVPVTTPLYQAVAAPPVPVALVPTGSPGGGPPILSNIPLPGGTGGFTPPLVTTTTPEVPATPVAPVPEPTTWAMMLLGFALMARALKRAPVPETA